MNLKFKDFQVDQDDPFSNDLLGRKTEIENLSSLICNINSPAVLAIDSPWGTGKTTFIRIWEAYLKNQKFGTLYFNAWATDFSEDPLVSFLGEMNQGLDELVGATTASKKAWSKTKAIGKQIAKRGLPALIKIGTVGVIDTEDLVEDELSKVLEGLTGDALDNYLKQKSAISQFHESLSELVQLSGEESPIVIFVDELDRCRPTYAISLLERIKHLFDIKGLVFVLSLDKSQLGHSIGSVYGEGIDSTAYLRRFIDFEYQLRRPEIEDYLKSLFIALSMDKYFHRRSKYQELRYDQEHLLNVFHSLAKAHCLSFREIEQLLALINLALRTARENEFIYPALLAFLVVAKSKQPGKYQRFTQRSVSESEMIEYLYELFPEEGRLDNHECRFIEGLLIAAKIDPFREKYSESMANHIKALEDENTTLEQRSYSESVVHIASNPGGLRGRINLSTLVERIEMLSQFKFGNTEDE